MVEQAQKDDLREYVEKETWTIEDHASLLGKLFTVTDAQRKFQEIVEDMKKKHPQAKGLDALKLGIASYMLCRFDAALEYFSSATDNKERSCFRALCYKAMRQYDKAAEEIEKARAKGMDAADASIAMAELLLLQNDVAGATKIIEKLAAKCPDVAEYQYVSGMAAEIRGEGDAAVAAYEKARTLVPGHPGATFRLAYYHDLHGDDELAMQLYKECVTNPPVHANALLNMAVLYEDMGRYEQAAACLSKIVAVNPNHARARMFLKDIYSSMNMYYDEDQAKRIAKRNAVLDIPVTDFELSVRARNCLRKMNIRTLGDLVKTTEAELLGYKNFGETSLREIKEMLTAKNLRLGQALEDDSIGSVSVAAVGQKVVANENVLSMSIDQVAFSIRCRRALDNLGVKVLGDIVSRSEAELLSCRNFGQTSLNEIRQRLSEYGLRLKEPE